MLGVGFPELLVIFLVIFLLFGPNALQDIVRAIGQAVKIFRKELGAMHQELDSTVENADSSRERGLKGREKALPGLSDGKNSSTATDSPTQAIPDEHPKNSEDV